MRAAAQTLLTLGRDRNRLGAELGITAVLHFWTRELAFHPHVHCIVTAGGLTADRRRWRPARQRHLFPLKVLGALFRGKVLAALQRDLVRGELSTRDPVATRRTIGALHQTPWLVDVKRPFGGAKRYRPRRRSGWSSNARPHCARNACRKVCASAGSIATRANARAAASAT